MLEDKRSLETKRAYRRDLNDFFHVISDRDPTPQLVSEFLRLERFTAIGLVLNYKSHLIQRGLKEATVNRRLAAIRSLVQFAQKIGKCEWSLEEVQGEKVQVYRDTSGVDQAQYRKLLAVPDRATLKGKRDYAILRLLWDNALRRGEVSKCDRGDFDPDARKLKVLGKGRGTQAQTIDLSSKSTEAIAAWMLAQGTGLATDPLFIALDRVSYGHRLSGNAIYKLVRETAEAAGINKVMSPHRCRHSAITAALDATGGDVRRVQKLSRHSKIETVMIYDDNRAGVQAGVTGLLSDLID
nr:tyrosine-type recombinase/integrase [Oculatella sp. LEGE 06141]